MNLKNVVLSCAVITGLAFGLPSCKSQEKKDAEAKAKIEATLTPGITVEVKDGVATLDGEFPDEAAKTAAEATAKNVPGVKSVVNNGTVTAPVVINPDEALITGVNGIVQQYPGVTATVNDGVVTLTGEIKKADWMQLKPMIDALRPKQVVNTDLNVK